MTDDLRREAEALLCRIQRGYRGVDADLADILAFAKAQRAAEARAIRQRCFGTTSFSDLTDWLDQRLKELKT